MPRKRVKPEKEKKLIQEIEEEELADLEGELEPEELESLEEEYEEEALEDLGEESLDEMAATEVIEEVEEESPEPTEEAGEPIQAASDADIGTEGEGEIEPFEEYEEEEEIPEAPIRRETRQELLGRLMIRLLDEREQVHIALERVRDLNTQMRDAGPRPPEKLKEQYHKAISDLSRVRRQENFARAELMQVLNWRG
jgi:hypothetical protein